MGQTAPIAEGTVPRALPGGVPDTLLNLYETYCLREVDGLLALLPPGGVRSLHREVARRRAEGTLGGEVDTFTALHDLARELLPLPDYVGWVGDFLEHREQYLAHLGVSPVPLSADPVTVGLRPFGEAWFAALVIHKEVHDWRGHLQFHRDGDPRSWRTADIFREEEALAVRDRFQALTPDSLQAFLRSVLP